MPGPGERIGDAYIRVRANGEDIGKAIEDGLADADVKGAAKKSADEYDKEWARRLRENRSTEKQIEKNLRSTIRKVKVIARETGDEYFKGIEVQLRKSANDSNVGADMARRIRNDFIRSGGDYDLLEKMLGDPKRISALFDDSRKHMARLHTDALRMNEEYNRQLQSSERANQRVFQRSDYVIKINEDMDRLGHTIGRVFGKGSRSEFLNFFGRLAGGLTSLALLIPKMAINIGSAIGNIVGAMRGGMGFFKALAGGAEQLGLTLPKLAGAFAAVGAAVVVLIFIIGPLISALSLLAGAVTALAGSLAFALVGALGGVLALVGPLVAGLGVVGLAFIGMSDKAKKVVKEAFRPLGEEFKRLGAVAREGLFSRLPETTAKLHSAFSGLRPLVREVSIAMADVGFGFAKAMNSPGFKAFRDAMFTFLPGAVRKLGEIFRNAIGGFGGIFRGMIPFMERVLDYLVKVTRAFSEWANSAKGQKSINSFFERAQKSLKSVWGFLKEIGGLIGDLFSSGRGSGDNLFKSMEDSVAKFRKFLKDNPDALKDWFKDAEEFAKKLGDAAVAAGRIMDELDDEGSRRNITSFFDGLEKTFDGIADAIDRIKDGFDGVRSLAEGDWLGGFEGFAGIFDFDDEIDGAKTKIREFFSEFSVPKPIRLAFSFIGASPLGKLKMLWDGFRSKTASLRAAISNSGAVQKLKGWWDGIKSKAASLKASISGSGIVQKVKGWWDGIKSKAASLKASIPGSGTISKVKGWWDGIKSKAAKLSVSVPGSGALSKAKGWWDGIKSKTVTLTQRIKKLFSASGGVLENGIRTMASGGMLDGFGQRMASGGFANFMQNYGLNNVIGESGREAIVPLDRPLSMVDPSVRALAAFAQGQIGTGTQVGVDASGWTIVSNAEDPAAVANKVLDRLTAASY